MNMPARYPERLVGISGYTVRPPQARRDKPRVSAFLSAKTDKILTLKPDLVIGFSDLQADIARDSRRCRSRPAIDGMPEDRLSIFHIKRDAAVACLVYLVLGITVAATFVLVFVRVQTVLRSKKVGSCLAIAGRFKRRVLNPGAFSIVPRL